MHVHRAALIVVAIVACSAQLSSCSAAATSAGPTVWAVPVSSADYYIGARVVRAAVALADPGATCVVFTVPEVAVSLPPATLRRDGWHALHVVDRIPAPHQHGEDTGKRAAVFTKLRAWELDMYGKIVLLDADVLPLSGSQAVARCSEDLCAAVSQRESTGRFNSGVLVLRPSRSVFENMKAQLPLLPSYNGGDQGFLNSFFDHAHCTGHAWNSSVQHRRRPGSWRTWIDTTADREACCSMASHPGAAPPARRSIAASRCQRLDTRFNWLAYTRRRGRLPHAACAYVAPFAVSTRLAWSYLSRLSPRVVRSTRNATMLQAALSGGCFSGAAILHFNYAMWSVKPWVWWSYPLHRVHWAWLAVRVEAAGDLPTGAAIAACWVCPYACLWLGIVLVHCSRRPQLVVRPFVLGQRPVVGRSGTAPADPRRPQHPRGVWVACRAVHGPTARLALIMWASNAVVAAAAVLLIPTHVDPILAWPLMYGAEVMMASVMGARFWREVAWWRAAARRGVAGGGGKLTLPASDYGGAAVPAPSARRRAQALRCGVVLVLGAVGAVAEAGATWGPLVCGVAVSPLHTRLASPAVWIGWWLAGAAVVRMLWAMLCARALLRASRAVDSPRHAQAGVLARAKQAV